MKSTRYIERDGFFAGLTTALDAIIIGHDQPVIADDMLRVLPDRELRAYARHIRKNENLPAIRKYVADAVRRITRKAPEAPDAGA